ncbi:hypothetical protein ACNKHU_20940 [Shigella flexneri]
MKFVKYFLYPLQSVGSRGSRLDYGLYRYIEPQLPDVATLKHVRLQIPMQIYSADGELIANTVRNVVFRLRWINLTGDGESLYR